MSKRIEVVTYDLSTGKLTIDHVWRVAHHHGRRKLKKLMKRAQRWLHAEQHRDHDDNHVVYLREV